MHSDEETTIEEGSMTIRAGERPQPILSDETASHLISLLAISVGLGLAFQVGHFVEHAVQFLVWLCGKSAWIVSNFCGRDMPFMSWPVAELVGFVGAFLFPEANVARQMMMGTEILHLVGNGLFLATIAGVFYFIPAKLVRYAFYIESAHLCEHIALTVSAYYLGYPIGLSTLFGHASAWWGREAAVGWRVSWHFVMNLAPMPFVMIAIMQHKSALLEHIPHRRGWGSAGRKSM